VDGLARDGVRFDACFTPYPLCSPARASLWTSLYPHEHDVLGNKRAISPPAGFSSPVAALRDAGYHTGYVGKWHVPGAHPRELRFADARALGRHWGRDIEEYRSYLRARGYTLSPHSVENLSEAELALLRGPNPPSCGTSNLPLRDYLEWWVTDRAIELVRDAAAGGAPFFLVCGWNAPHFPMIVPAPYDTLYDPATVPLPPSFEDRLDGKPAVQHVRPSSTRVQHLTPEGWRKLIAHYWGLVSLVDEQVGRLLTELDRLGLSDDTVVVYMSDHGDLMGSHHLMEKGAWNVYEETVRTPLVIKAPQSATAGRVATELVSGLDLMPTLLELAGVAAPEGLSGRSAAPLLARGTEEWPDAIYGETAALSERPGVDPPLAQAELDPEDLLVVKWVRTHRWKYACYSNDLDELYDLGTDPWETRNLAVSPEHSGVVESFRARLLAWMDRTADPLLPKLRPKLSGGPVDTRPRP
jgi:arylsulfatase A-like enzyme